MNAPVRLLMPMLLVGLANCCALARAEATLPPLLQKVGFDQRLNEQVPPDIEFTNEAGEHVRIGDCFRDKPVVLVLAQYRCKMLCTMVLNGLTQGLMDVPFDVGKDFQVVTVSFDARETPDLAAAKKKTYVERYGRPGAAAGWHFLTGNSDSIERLAKAVGFRYTYDPKHDQFAHASGIILLTPSGKVSRYFYDIKYSGRDLRLGLVEASENKIGSPVEQILLYCFHYDPSEGKYGAAVMNFVRLGGALTLVVLIGFIGALWRRERRKPAVAQGIS